MSYINREFESITAGISTKNQTSQVGLTLSYLFSKCPLLLEEM